MNWYACAATCRIDIPLIFVSNSTALQLRVDAIRAGGDGYLVALDDDAAAVAAQIRPPPPDQQRPYRVVVVEDDRHRPTSPDPYCRKAGSRYCRSPNRSKVIESLRENVQARPDPDGHLYAGGERDRANDDHP